MREVFTTLRFERRLSNFIAKHLDLESTIEYVMQRVAFDKIEGLQVRAFKGILKGCRAARISYEYRLAFVLKRGGVCFIDIGTHDDVYR